MGTRSVPVTFPFALIPVIPNFPMFYVLWRAWSHYKAWRGASYLESLLKLGFIVEKPSPELDEIYRSRGVVVGEEGSEDHAPDQTSSEGVKLGKVSGNRTEQKGGEVKMDGVREMPDQAKGREPAPDGTSTPPSMMYQPKGSTSTTATAKIETPSPRHPSMLLGLGQAKVLAKTFGLKSNEATDLNRAVEQAELRARAADKVNAEEMKADDGGSTEKPVTTWRGNLHR